MFPLRSISSPTTTASSLLMHPHLAYTPRNRKTRFSRSNEPAFAEFMLPNAPVRIVLEPDPPVRGSINLRVQLHTPTNRRIAIPKCRRNREAKTNSLAHGRLRQRNNPAPGIGRQTTPRPRRIEDRVRELEIEIHLRPLSPGEALCSDLSVDLSKRWWREANVEIDVRFGQPGRVEVVGFEEAVAGD